MGVYELDCIAPVALGRVDILRVFPFSILSFKSFLEWARQIAGIFETEIGVEGSECL